MKIVLKESRTLQVPDILVNSITRIYRGAFIKLVVDFVENKINKNANPRLTDKYNQLLEEIQNKYSKEISDSSNLGFINDLNMKDAIQNGELIESIPVEQFIMALLDWPGLEGYVRGRIKPKQLKTRLKRYFKNKNVDDIQFNIEFGARGTTKKKDYAGLYESDIDAINITFNSSFFISIPTGQQDVTGKPITAAPGLSVASRSIDAILDNIDTELEDTRTSVRHEVQHLFQNMMSNVLGTGDWKVGLPPKDVLKKTKSSEREAPHHMQSIEMQTDIQDEADKFASYVRAFKQKNPDKADIFPKAIKLMAKLFVDSKLNDEEKRFSDKNNLDIYISPSDLFRTIKSDRGAKELYKYAIKVLAGSVMDDL